MRKAQQIWPLTLSSSLPKYRDMIIKPTKKDGSFEKTLYDWGATSFNIKVS